MKRVLLWKGLAVSGLALLLLLPLAMIQGQITARSQRKTQVEDNIAQSAAGRQRFTGPLLLLDYTVEEQVWATDAKSGELLKDPRTGQSFTRLESVPRTKVLVPRDLEIQGQVQVEERYRGIYKAPIFHLDAGLKGAFEVPADIETSKERKRITLDRVRVAMVLSDLRGIQNRPQLKWEGRLLDFGSGETCRELGRGLVVDLGSPAQFLGRNYAFEIPALKLMGTQQLAVAPVAEDTRMALHSSWPDPSFGGRFLPVNRKIGEKGFEAQWQVSGVARDLEAILQNQREGQFAEAFEVSFVEPVNIYLQSERAVKYGFLFVGLVFAGFFLFEMLKALRIHPMQYLLVGFSLALFFLLLFSLSEHVAFPVAYGAAAGSSILLLWVYLSGVLKGWRHSSIFAAGLAVLYGVLYGLLASEDNALVMGSALLFAILAGVMLLTRRLDWYGVSRGSQAGEGLDPA
jgi:inner membrane protein